MNKNEIIGVVAAKSGFSKKDSEAIVDCFLSVIADALTKEEKVVLSNFGTFEVRHRVARSGINPRTGETISIPAQKTPAFVAGKQLKDNLR